MRQLRYRITRYCSAALAGLLVAVLSVAASAATVPSRFKPAVIYSFHPHKTKNAGTDHAFIDAARVGIEKANAEYGITIPEYPVKPGENLMAAMKRVAALGATPIIALGGQNVPVILELAEQYPNTQFTVVDGLVPPIFPNVQSIMFKDHEGSFLVGYIAARIAGSGHIGFIGGMDSPQIRNFAAGYAHGARYVNAQAEVSVDMIGQTSAAWSDPEAARMLALKQFNQGAEVIFAAAGGSTLGVLKAANETGKLAIGVDSNQNGLYPGHVLTSLVKRMDIAVYASLKHSHDGTWNPGIKYLGIKEGALDYVVDSNNRSLISEPLIEDVSTAKERVINGLITVDSYNPK